MALTGRLVVVTGASSGIGRACAEMAARLGARVVLVARRQDVLSSVLSALPNSDVHCTCSCDVTSEADVLRLAEQVAQIGKVDGFVHAAGISLAVPLRAMDASAMRRVYETNVLSFTMLMQKLATRRTANPGFSTVAVSSVAAVAGWSGVSAYAGSKGALSAVVRALAIELAPLKFRVNAVCPSNIRTPMLDELTQGLDREEVLKTLASRQPLGLGTPEQVAAPVCFLLGRGADFITGVNLPVDGGYLAQ